MASLIVASGPRCGEVFWLGERVNIIGSGQWASMRIMDKSTSEEHIKVYHDPAAGSHCLCPMDPHNPVYVNGRQTTSDRRLFEEDRILVGNTVLVFTQKDVGHVTKTFAQVATGTGMGPVEEAGALSGDEADSQVCGWMTVHEGAAMTFVRWFGEIPNPAALRQGIPSGSMPGRALCLRLVPAAVAC